MSCLIAAGAGYCLARCMDQGLADAMGLRTLRHGTDPVTWMKIHTQGAKPSYDASGLAGERFALANPCGDYGISFQPLWNYLDSELQTSQLREKVIVYIPETVLMLSQRVYSYVIYNRMVSYVTKASPLMGFLYSTGPVQIVMKRVLMHSVPMVQKSIATYRFVRKNWPSSSLLVHLFQLSLVPFLCLMTPTIKFRLHPNQMEEFHDILLGRVVLYTEQEISLANMGLVGIFNNSLRSLWPPILRAPIQVTKGVCVLVAAGAVGYGALTLAPGFIAAHQVALIAGALLAVV